MAQQPPPTRPAKPTMRRTTSQASSGSTGSQDSAGIGAGFATVSSGPPRDDLPPNLTPENFALDQSIKVYDVIVYLIYCPEHDKIAVTNVERARCVWLPFVCLPDATTWRKASHDGVMNIIGNTDSELDATVAAKKAPVFDLHYMNLLRVQLPSEKFVTRLANLVVLKKSADSTFKCCQRSPRINWLRVVDICDNRIEKIWGPEVKALIKLMVEMNKDEEHEALISEFTVQNSFHYLELEDSAEQKMLRSAHVKSEHVIEIYEDFVEHCFPAFAMSFEAFKYYLVKKGFDRNDPRLQYLFNAFSLYNKDYLDFHETLLGVVAMEPTTKHQMEARLKFIWRYYDTSRVGYLTLDQFAVMVADIAKAVQPTVELSDAELNARCEEAIACVGLTKDKTIVEANFIKAVKGAVLPHTEQLCRSPKPILPQLSRLMQAKTETKARAANEGFLVSRRNTKGTCGRCQAQKYAYNMHAVTLDTSGRCVEPRIISEQWIEPVATPDGMNEHKYSVEYVFGNSSMPNVFVDLIKDYYYKSHGPPPATTAGDQTNGAGATAQPPKLSGLMAVPEDWTVFSKYVTLLCEQLKGLLTNEDKLIKINAPALVVGDLQGNLHDLLVMEKHYWHSFPVIPISLVFLGNYSGLLANGIECLLYLFALKLLMPNKMFLLRGTNEMRSVNKRALRDECLAKYGADYGRKVFDTLNNVFERLPFAVIIDETIFCAHSGIPKSTRIVKLNQLPKDIASVYKDAPIGYELLVNQPQGIEDTLSTSKYKDRLHSQHKSEVGSVSVSAKCKSTKSDTTTNPATAKGGGTAVGSTTSASISTTIGVTGFTASDNYMGASAFDATAFGNFCRANGFAYMIRSHSVVPPEGFDLRFGNRCITVFSCTNYMQHFAQLVGKESEAQAKQQPPNVCNAVFVDGSNSRIRLLAFDTRGHLEPITAVPPQQTTAQN